MVVQNPQMAFVYPMVNAKFDTKSFKCYTKDGPRVAFVVWPALMLHEGGRVVCKGVAQGRANWTINVHAWILSLVILKWMCFLCCASSVCGCTGLVVVVHFNLAWAATSFLSKVVYDTIKLSIKMWLLLYIVFYIQLWYTFSCDNVDLMFAF